MTTLNKLRLVAFAEPYIKQIQGHTYIVARLDLMHVVVYRDDIPILEGEFVDKSSYYSISLEVSREYTIYPNRPIEEQVLNHILYNEYIIDRLKFYGVLVPNAWQHQDSIVGTLVRIIVKRTHDTMVRLRFELVNQPAFYTLHTIDIDMPDRLFAREIENQLYQIESLFKIKGV